jgi:hypothetical protein
MKMHRRIIISDIGHSAAVKARRKTVGWKICQKRSNTKGYTQLFFYIHFIDFSIKINSAIFIRSHASAASIGIATVVYWIFFLFFRIIDNIMLFKGLFKIFICV